MKLLLITLTILLSFTACQDKKNDAKAQAAHDAQIAAKARAEVEAKYAAKKIAEQKALNNTKHQEQHAQNNSLNQVGIDMHNGTIIIDTNKTQSYFSDLTSKMESQMKKISEDLQKGIIEEKDAGIQVNQEHINIDLNKTKKLLQDWASKIEVFAQEFDNLANTFEQNISKGN